MFSPIVMAFVGVKRLLKAASKIRSLAYVSSGLRMALSHKWWLTLGQAPLISAWWRDSRFYNEL